MYIFKDNRSSLVLNGCEYFGTNFTLNYFI